MFEADCLCVLFVSSSFLSSLTPQTMNPDTADAIVNIMIGVGSYKVEIKGDSAEKHLLRKLHMPRAVAQKRIGNTSALLTYMMLKF